MKPIQTTKIGGMRRKIKRINPIKNKDNSKEFKTYEKNVKILNDLIKSIPIEEYSKFKIFLDTEMEDIAFSIEKYDLLKSSKIKNNFKDFKENRLEYLYNYYCLNLDRPVEFKLDAYSFFKLNFEQESLLILVKFIEEITIGIEKKIYLDINKDNYTIDDVNYAFDLLKLNKSEIPNKEEIEKSYNNLYKDLNEKKKKELDKALNLLLIRYCNNSK